MPATLASAFAALAVSLASGSAHAQAYGGGLAPVPGTTIDDELRTLLAAWRKQDLSGLACAHCHAPDAMDLAVFAVSDADILRRASFHVGPADAQSILALVQRMRTQHVASPRDRFAARPFQPGLRLRHVRPRHDANLEPVLRRATSPPKHCAPSCIANMPASWTFRACAAFRRRRAHSFRAALQEQSTARW
jgi:hypothetical protein